MIIHDVEQGTEDWHHLRLGIPTASEFDKIITSTGKLSAQADKYAYRLIAEKLLNRPLISLDGLEWIERGKLLESDAVKAYAFSSGMDVSRVGFITTDDGKIGCSPDALVGSVGQLEIKCPAPQTHVGYMIEGPGKDYKQQIQGQLMVSEREWSDFYSHHPEMPPVEIRTYRDEPFIKLMRAALDEFNDRLAGLMETVKAKGYFAEPTRIVSVVEAAYGETLDY